MRLLPWTWILPGPLTAVALSSLPSTLALPPLDVRRMSASIASAVFSAAALRSRGPFLCRLPLLSSLASRPSDVHQFAHDYFAAMIPPAQDATAADEQDDSALASADADEAATPRDEQEEEQ